MRTIFIVTHIKIVKHAVKYFRYMFNIEIIVFMGQRIILKIYKTQ